MPPAFYPAVLSMDELKSLEMAIQIEREQLYEQEKTVFKLYMRDYTDGISKYADQLSSIRRRHKTLINKYTKVFTEINRREVQELQYRI